MKTLPDPIAELRQHLIELSHLKHALTILHWDNELFLPELARSRRSETINYLTNLVHDRFTSDPFQTILAHAYDALRRNLLNDTDAAIVREVWRESSREKKLTPLFVQQLTEATTIGYHAWHEAKTTKDFSLFLPVLKRIVLLKQEEAQLIGYSESPYDALLDTYEPNLTTAATTSMLSELTSFLIPFLKTIQSTPPTPPPPWFHGSFDIHTQKEFVTSLLRDIGFNFSAGRLDESLHPFTTATHPFDTRITTSFDPENIFVAISGVMHEFGHGLYEQGLPVENFGTPLAESASLSIHESQSRLWENIIGLSRPFCQFLQPRLAESFPRQFSSVSAEDLYRGLNRVQPSLIRIHADEVTYNLHIALRFELERDVIEGRLPVAELPEAWREYTRKFFDIVPADEQILGLHIHNRTATPDHFLRILRHDPRCAFIGEHHALF
jgi:carboxypeptidase Taq